MLLRRELIFLVSLMFGFLLSPRVELFVVLSLTIVAFSCLLMSLMLFLLVQVRGSSMSLSLRMLSTSGSLPISGHLGELLSPAFLPWLSGGEEGKCRVKGATIRYCCNKSAARSKNRDLLVRLADHLKARIDRGSVSCLAPYHGVLSSLAKLDLDAAVGAQVRSRIKWVEEGESSTA